MNTLDHGTSGARTLPLILLFTGCSIGIGAEMDSSVADGAIDAQPEMDAALLDGETPDGETTPDAGPICEPDFQEPDDAVARLTWDAFRAGGAVAYTQTWDGTWFSDGFGDVDRVRVSVPQELAAVVPDQVWVGAATDARDVQLTVACVEGGFIGCEDGIQANPATCLREGSDSVTMTGHCSRGAATLELVARQMDDAPCQRSMRVDIAN